MEYTDLTPPEIPGCTWDEIHREPDWANTSSHRIGLRGRDDRFMGFTNSGEAWRYDIDKDAERKLRALREKTETGNLLTVRDFLSEQMPYHLVRPEVHPINFRTIVKTTEGFIKDEQPWPANVKKYEEQLQDRGQKWAKERERLITVKTGIPEELLDEQTMHRKRAIQEEEELRKAQPGDGGKQGEWPLDQLLEYERKYLHSLKNHDGQGKSPVSSITVPRGIDEAYQFTPDNWVARYERLNRLAGKHPMNGEVPITTLYEGGLITPSGLHYVRNHGPVPHLVWETHRLEVTAGKYVTFSMDELKDKFSSINIPVLLACEGNRRKELTMVKRTKGVNFTTAAASCVYWKGVLLRDVLLAADVHTITEDKEQLSTRLWINFEGADESNEGNYATSIPLMYALDAVNDVMLAYEMNDAPLPADNGYPLRLIIPGWVGGRCVKWLSRIWVTDYENESYYHLYDNRLLPSFVTDTTTDVANAMFKIPSTLCNEQMLNSVITKPEQGEKLSVADIKSEKVKTYRIEGYAYAGNGNQIQRVEISLDNGKYWIYCIRMYPDRPIRHGYKFWTWIHWYADIDASRLLDTEKIMVRCYDAFQNTQPENPQWNILGMMNNCWYTVKPAIVKDPESTAAHLTFRHPCEQGGGTEGWMEGPPEVVLEDVDDQAVYDKQFTREEIEKHYTEDDAWLVINGKVYNASKVLDTHPGGRATIMAHAGRVHLDTTEEFDAVHDEWGYTKLKTCLIGRVTEKAMGFMKREAEMKAKQHLENIKNDPEMALTRNKYSQAKLVKKQAISEDVNRYTFKLPSNAGKFGLEIGQHVQIGFHFADRILLRPLTPVRPIFDSEYDGTFDLVVKTHYADSNQPGGTLTNILDSLRMGEEIEIKGPSGSIRYQGGGSFNIDERQYKFDRLLFIVGGTGVLPGFQVMARVLRSTDEAKIKFIDVNKSEDDILLRTELDDFSRNYPDQVQITHLLSRPSKKWQGEKGHLDKEKILRYGYEPDERTGAFVCGPPALIEQTVMPTLTEWGYDHQTNLFGF